MSDPVSSPREVTRVLCASPRKFAPLVTETLLGLGVHTVLVENARAVRQFLRPRAGILPGLTSGFDDSPMEIFRTTVSRESAPGVCAALVNALDLHSPGRGSLIVQDIVEHSDVEVPSTATRDEPPPLLSRDLTLLTGILSQTGGGEPLARAALKLGVCVPLVSRGAGTGIRDQLGLLRVTIPPEKELVHLLVPSHDAGGLFRLLIEGARLDRPGGGFLYQTPVRVGVVDPLLRIGRQEHAASMEQLIAAMDEIKGGSTWRKRFSDVEDREKSALRPLRRNHREVVFICDEGGADALVHAAMAAGATGATTARLRCLSASDIEGGVGARERGILCVPAARQDPVVRALRETQQENGRRCRVQVLEAPAIFSHQRG